MAKIKIKKAERPPRNIAYLRVSTQEQDTEKNKADILTFANDRKFGTVEFVEEKVSGTISWKDRKIKGIIDELGECDRLIVPELSRLGRSMLEIVEILSIAKRNGIAVYAIKGGTEEKGWELNGDTIQSKVMLMIFSMVSEIERDLISSRTKEGLRAARAKGKLLGRPCGPGKSKLDPYKDEIIAFLKTSSTKVWIAEKYHSTVPNLLNWMKKNNIKIPRGGEHEADVGDKVKVYLPKDRYEGMTGVVMEVLDVGIVVQFNGGEKQIYHKRGEVKRVKGERHEASQH